MPEGLQLPDLRALLSIGYPIRLGAGDLILFTAKLADDSDAVGKTLADAPFGAGVWLLEIRHGDATEQPQRDSVLNAGDQLVLMLSGTQLPSLINNFEFPAVFRNWMARHEPELHDACFSESG